MVNLSSWKMWGIGFVGLSGVLFAAWSFLPAQARAGGIRLLLQADIREVANQRAETMEEVIRRELRSASPAIPVSEITASNGVLRFTVDDPAQLIAAVAVARRQIGQVRGSGAADWAVAVADGRQVIMRLTEAGANDAFRQTMEVTRDVIARRIEAWGAPEPTITTQGANRILVQVPGVQDSEALKRLIGRTARLEFKLVEIGQLSCNTLRRPGIRYLPADELPAGQCMGVQSRAVISGDQIEDARQDFDESSQVSVRVSFNLQGSHRFAQVTRANVGRRFAIILDNRIISAPVINEPILGGSASIAGAFTVESANALAISLRSGRLPVALHVVDERSIGPNTRPSGAKAAN